MSTKNENKGVVSLADRRATREAQQFMAKRGTPVKYEYLKVPGKYQVLVTRVLIDLPQDTHNNKYRIRMHTTVTTGPHKGDKVSFKCEVANLQQFNTCPRLNDAVEAAVGHEIFDDYEFNLPALFMNKEFIVVAGHNVRGAKDVNVYVRIHQFLRVVK